eukprot:3620-Heterococcus_DN1.PRE.1
MMNVIVYTFCSPFAVIDGISCKQQLCHLSWLLLTRNVKQAAKVQHRIELHVLVQMDFIITQMLLSTQCLCSSASVYTPQKLMPKKKFPLPFAQPALSPLCQLFCCTAAAVTAATTTTTTTTTTAASNS